MAVSRKPKKKQANDDIDRMIAKMRQKFDGLDPEIQLKVISTAVNWEKIKHGLGSSDKGSFFGDEESED